MALKLAFSPSRQFPMSCAKYRAGNTALKVQFTTRVGMNWVCFGSGFNVIDTLRRETEMDFTAKHTGRS